MYSAFKSAKGGGSGPVTIPLFQGNFLSLPPLCGGRGAGKGACVLATSVAQVQVPNINRNPNRNRKEIT
jgi:hypothetical protein